MAANGIRVVCYSQRTLPSAYIDDIGGLHAFIRNCHNQVGREYIEIAMAKAHYIVLALKPASHIKHLPQTRSRSNKSVVAGFAFMEHNVQNTERENSGLYISLICSNNRTGKMILRKVEEKAKAMRLSFVNLNSLELATEFYYKNDFKYVHFGDNPCNMTHKKVRKDSVKKKDEGSYTWDMAKCILAKP